VISDEARRWWAQVAVAASVLVVGLDLTVLNLARRSLSRVPGGGAAGARAACPPCGAQQARCYALYTLQIAVNAAIAAQAAGRPATDEAMTPKGWGATDIEHAYKLPVGRSPDATVAVVDAYTTPHLASDLGAYRACYHLPPCTTGSGCLRIVNQRGQTAPLPAADRPAGG
jgi:hypothetical protein